MAISYFDTQSTGGSFGTSGTGSGNVYKDLAITGAQSGDLIVVFVMGENYAGAGTRSVATQSGSTGSWTLVSPAVTASNDVDFVGGYALVSAPGTVTVRGTLRYTSSMRMGVAAFLIPAAEVGATYGFVGSGFAADTDGQTSVTLSTSSTTLYGAADWAATNMGSTTTPAGGTVHRTYFDTTNYSLFVGSWTGQTAGTRNYGPSGLSGHDVSGAVFRMDTAGGGGSFAGTVQFDSVSTVSGVPVARLAAAGTVPAASGLTVSPVARLAATVSFTSTSGLTVSPVAALAGAVTVGSASSFTGSPVAALVGTVSIPASSTFAVSSNGTFPATVTFGSTSTVTAAPVARLASTVTSGSTSGLTMAPVARLASSRTFTSTSTFGASSTVPTDATVLFVSSSGMTAVGAARVAGTVALGSTSALTAAPTVPAAGAVLFVSVTGFTATVAPPGGYPAIPGHRTLEPAMARTLTGNTTRTLNGGTHRTLEEGQ